jgi:hypothetical protein
MLDLAMDDLSAAIIAPRTSATHNFHEFERKRFNRSLSMDERSVWAKRWHEIVAVIVIVPGPHCFRKDVIKSSWWGR